MGCCESGKKIYNESTETNSGGFGEERKKTSLRRWLVLIVIFLLVFGFGFIM